MIDLRIHGKIPLLNDYGFEKGVLLFSLICFGESYRSCSAGRRRAFPLQLSVCVSISSWRTTMLIRLSG